MSPRSIHFDDFGTYKCLERIENESVDLCLITCGMEQCMPGHSFGPGIRDEFILHFILQGTGYVSYGDGWTTLGAQTVFAIFPHQTVTYCADKNDPWHYMWVGFRGLKAPVYVERAGFRPDAPIRSSTHCLLIKSYIQQMINSRLYTHANDCKRTAALLEILALLMDEAECDSKDANPSAKQSYVEQAKQYVEQNYQRELTVAAMADAVGVNRSYLTRLFREVTNLTPQEYIRQFRLDRAALLLETPSVSVTQAARLVGYPEYVTFAKHFKAQRGMTPTQYRTRILQERAESG